jgi:hypothetical protein
MTESKQGCHVEAAETGEEAGMPMTKGMPAKVRTLETARMPAIAAASSNKASSAARTPAAVYLFYQGNSKFSYKYFKACT